MCLGRVPWTPKSTEQLFKATKSGPRRWQQDNYKIHYGKSSPKVYQKFFLEWFSALKGLHGYFEKKILEESWHLPQIGMDIIILLHDSATESIDYFASAGSLEEIWQLNWKPFNELPDLNYCSYDIHFCLLFSSWVWFFLQRSLLKEKCVAASMGELAGSVPPSPRWPSQASQQLGMHNAFLWLKVLRIKLPLLERSTLSQLSNCQQGDPSIKFTHKMQSLPACKWGLCTQGGHCI